MSSWSAASPANSCCLAPLEATPAPPPSKPQRRVAALTRRQLGTSSLRRVSAYCGGFQDNEMELRGAVVAKKALSFADQHGSQLVLERWFFCHEPSTRSYDAAACEGGALLPNAADLLPQPYHLLPMCVASCSFVVCVLLGRRHFVQ